MFEILRKGSQPFPLNNKTWMKRWRGSKHPFRTACFWFIQDGSSHFSVIWCKIIQTHSQILDPSHHFIPPLTVANLRCFAKDELVLNHHCFIGKLEIHGIHLPHGLNMLYYRGWSANRYCAIFTVAKYIVYLLMFCSFIYLSIDLFIYLQNFINP